MPPCKPSTPSRRQLRSDKRGPARSLKPNSKQQSPSSPHRELNPSALSKIKLETTPIPTTPPSLPSYLPFPSPLFAQLQNKCKHQIKHAEPPLEEKKKRKYWKHDPNPRSPTPPTVKMTVLNRQGNLNLHRHTKFVENVQQEETGEYIYENDGGRAQWDIHSAMRHKRCREGFCDIVFIPVPHCMIKRISDYIDLHN